MKWVLALVVSALAAALPAAASAAVMCPARVPAVITSAAADSVKCQQTIVKQGEKFLKTKMKVMSKCLLKESLSDCPDAKGVEKIEKAANKAEQKIADKCGTDAIQAGLASSYANLTDDGVITSCMLSQHNVVGQLAALNATGIDTDDWELFDDDTNKARSKCIKELSKSGTKYVQKALKNANKCILKQMKKGVGGNLADICVGQYTGTTTAFLPPSDTKTAAKQAKLVGKIEAKLDKKCTPGMVDYIASIFACPGATTLDDLKECLLCEGWSFVLDALEQQYSETGVHVPNGPGAIQLAVNAGTTGTKLLIAPGDYNEQVVMGADGQQLVGCGGAEDDRPRILPPLAGTPPFINGVTASNLDNLVFQSIEVNDFDENDIFVTMADGVVFRDTITRGPGTPTDTEYGLFPILSNNVLVEASVVTGVRDAGIYVGQSTNIVVRYNEVEANVAGIEIENSAHADVHNNHAHDNTGGLLVFKLPGLTVQLSNCHDVHHNLLEENDIANFGSGFVGLVPPGTGALILSNDETTFEYNRSRENDSLGFAITDQLVANLLFPGSFPSPSPDPTLEDNFMRHNIFIDNGTNPDPAIAGLESDALFFGLGASGNCQNDNLFGTEVGFAALPVCTGNPGCSVP